MTGLADAVEFRVTFGQMYARDPHPTLEVAHPDGWLAVFSDDQETARRAVFARVGVKWAFIYGPDDPAYPTAEGHYPRGELARMTARLIVNGPVATYQPTPAPAPVEVRTPDQIRAFRRRLYGGDLTDLPAEEWNRRHNELDRLERAAAEAERTAGDRAPVDLLARLQESITARVEDLDAEELDAARLRGPHALGCPALSDDPNGIHFCECEPRET